MPTLQESLAGEAQRSNVITDCENLIQQEVDSKSGLSGIAIKTAFKVVKNVKPGFIRNVIDGLLDDFCAKLQPIVDESQAQQKPVSTFFADNRGRVADALLSITDEKAQKTKYTAIKATYEKLRGSAKKNVEAAAPRVGSMIEKYT